MGVMSTACCRASADGTHPGYTSVTPPHEVPDMWYVSVGVLWIGIPLLLYVYAGAMYWYVVQYM
jgi:hypothetical protein